MLLRFTYLSLGFLISFANQPAVIKNRQGAPIGTASLEIQKTGSVLTTTLWNIEPGWHAMHLHENADCSDGASGFMKAGGHANPHEKKHGVGSHVGYHLGDLANVYAFSKSKDPAERGDKAQSKAQQILPYFTIKTKPVSYALILHAQPDDYYTDPHGRGGPRIGCAIVHINQESN